MRRYVRIGLITLVSLLVVGVAALTIGYHVPAGPARRDATWGVEHVTGYSAPSKAGSLFGHAKKGGSRPAGKRSVDPRWRFIH